MRKCEICGDKNQEKLYRQKFVTAGKENFSYDVVSCRKCGFLFASLPVSQEKLDKFYKKNTKYTYNKSDGNTNEAQEFISKYFLNLIIKHLNSRYPHLNRNKFKIIDIGCGNGLLLSYFKKKNFKKIIGIDPAYQCSIIAREKYGVKVIASTLDEYQTKDKFDLVVLTAVLEHVRDLNNFLNKINTLLNKNGMIAVCVPDTENFIRKVIEPFSEFSLEHINFFTRMSLSNLLNKLNYKNIAFKSKMADSKGSFALYGLWKKENTTSLKLEKDNEGILDIKKYVIKSNKILSRLREKYAQLLKTKEKVIVWGVGSLTSRLLADTDFQLLNIEAFIDSNVQMQNKKIKNIKIYSPDYLSGKKTTILVSSFNYGKEIKNILLKKLHYSGKIILL